ncbi:MAG: hypothetical protein ACRDOI_34420, partial [Trebonia sp.]
MRLHPSRTPYTEPQVRKWLTALADGLAWQSRHGMSGTDIVLHQWWRPAGRRITRGLHIAIAMLPGITALVTAAATRHGAFPTARNYGLVVAGCALLLIGLLAAFQSSPRRVKIRKLTTRQGLRSLALRISFGLAVGFMVGYGRGSGSELWVASGSGSGGALTVALTAGLPFGFTFGLADAAPDDRGPLGAIRADGAFGLVVGLAVCLSVGLGTWVVFGPALGATQTFERWFTNLSLIEFLFEFSYWLFTGLALGLAFWLSVALSAGLVVGLAFGGV